METLRGKTVVGTGARSGIGRAIALTLAQDGARIVVSDIRIEAATRIVAEIRDLGAKAIAAETDVSNHESVKAIADAAYDEFWRSGHSVQQSRRVLATIPHHPRSDHD